jgi:hypothetical protein
LLLAYLLGPVLRGESTMRSMPGEGKPILLYVIGDKDEFADDICLARTEGNESVICGCIDEDYSTCRWPVVVKVQRGYTAEYVADRLQDLVDQLRGDGHMLEVPEELTDYARREAEEDARRLGIAK